MTVRRPSTEASECLLSWRLSVPGPASIKTIHSTRSGARCGRAYNTDVSGSCPSEDIEDAARRAVLLANSGVGFEEAADGLEELAWVNRLCQQSEVTPLHLCVVVKVLGGVLA
jgi:hypothetical protein